VVTYVIDRNLPGGTEEFHEKPQLLCPMFQFILEPSISGIEFYHLFNLLIYRWFCEGFIVYMYLCLIKNDTMKRRVEEV
jgi:hypothetical protein